MDKLLKYYRVPKMVKGVAGLREVLQVRVTMTPS
jgi:hypothetical protein